MFIPIAKPENDYLAIPNLEKNFIKEFNSGIYVGGDNVKKLESNLSKFLKVKYISSVNSGTDALYLSLKALGLGKNDEVIIPSFTYVATLEAVLRVGSTPIFADIDENSYCISLKTVSDVVTDKTKCIIPVHLYGYNSDIENIYKFASKNNIFIVEDSAQSFGSKNLNGEYLGSVGNTGAFSNYPTKTLGGIGDGGFVSTNNKNIYEKINKLKDHGQNKKYSHLVPGYNSRMDSLNAYILNQKLLNFKSIQNSRNIFIEFYDDFFSDFQKIKTIEFNKNTTLLNYYSIILPKKDRNKINDNLNLNDVNSRIYYRKPLHLQPVTRNYDKNRNDKRHLPLTEIMSNSVLSLPLYSFPTKPELKFLKDKLHLVFKGVK